MGEKIKGGCDQQTSTGTPKLGFGAGQEKYRLTGFERRMRRIEMARGLNGGALLRTKKRGIAKRVMRRISWNTTSLGMQKGLVKEDTCFGSRRSNNLPV